MQVTSSDFQDQDPIPKQHSYNGGNASPSLTFSEIPDATESLALIVEDPDSPHSTFTHWILYDMSPGVLQVLSAELPISGQQGLNDFKEMSYGGPKPNTGTHHYVFTLYALDTYLQPEVRETFDRNSFDRAIDGHIIETASLTGTFDANDN